MSYCDDLRCFQLAPCSTHELSLETELERERVKFSEAHQEHIFRFLPELNDQQKKSFLHDIKTVDASYVNKAYESIAVDEEKRKHEKILPFTGHTQVLKETSEEQKQKWREEGLLLIAQGKVGCVLMAGGQGTRLGSDKPKGMYDIGLPSHKSIFQLQAEKIMRLREIAGKKYEEKNGSNKSSNVSLPWYILTSESTHEGTIEFFEQHNFFNLPRGDVFFFEQELMPCLTKEGKIILETSFKLSKAPNGNGGVHSAIANSGALKHMREHGVEHLHIYGVDNVLVKIADPVFIGYCATMKADAANKVVLKENPHERVGVMCERGGTASVCEYSEISKEMAELRDAQGRLVYSGANIANHYFTVDFVEQVTSQVFLAPHVASKQIPYVNKQGKTTMPEQPNGIKLELFVFDVFQFAKKLVCFAVDREEEFSGVKNKNGPGDQPPAADTPASARLALSKYYAKLATQAGATVAFSEPLAVFEISPLLTYDGEGLENLVKGKNLTAPFSLP